MNVPNVVAIEKAITAVFAELRALPEGAACWLDPKCYVATDILARDLAARGVLAVDALSDEQIDRSRPGQRDPHRIHAGRAPSPRHRRGGTARFQPTGEDAP